MKTNTRNIRRAVEWKLWHEQAKFMRRRLLLTAQPAVALGILTWAMTKNLWYGWAVAMAVMSVGMITCVLHYQRKVEPLRKTFEAEVELEFQDEGRAKP